MPAAYAMSISGITKIRDNNVGDQRALDSQQRYGARPPVPLPALLQVDAGMAQREYEAGGQQGLDELLAALDGGFQGAGLAATDDAALSKIVLARRTDVKFQGRLDPLALLNALQVS